MADIGRDWDDELVSERERTFKIGGELFEWIYPHWEIGAKIFDESLSPPLRTMRPRSLPRLFHPHLQIAAAMGAS